MKARDKRNQFKKARENDARGKREAKQADTRTWQEKAAAREAASHVSSR